MVFAGNLLITRNQYNILFSYNRLGLAHLFSSILSLRVLNSQFDNTAVIFQGCH